MQLLAPFLGVRRLRGAQWASPKDCSQGLARVSPECSAGNFYFQAHVAVGREPLLAGGGQSPDSSPAAHRVPAHGPPCRIAHNMATRFIRASRGGHVRRQTPNSFVMERYKWRITVSALLTGRKLPTAHTREWGPHGCTRPEAGIISAVLASAVLRHPASRSACGSRTCKSFSCKVPAGLFCCCFVFQVVLVGSGW